MKRLVACALFLGAGRVMAEEFTRLKADEQVVFYPTFAHRVPERNGWRAEIRGCVFEPEQARLAVAALRNALELKAGELTGAEEEIFNRRARLFLVDHERGKNVFIRLGTNQFFIGKSGADGMFAGEIEFRNAASVTAFTAILPPEDQRQFTGMIFSLPETGISVISDIDDTIKITEVRDQEATLRNTFLREFKAVPGMAEFYQGLARSNRAAFHYVSASPWQLFAPLSQFSLSNGFPAGTFHLKSFRWKDRTFMSLFADPVEYKLGVIEPLVKKFPNRQFILVGDSGERDPEIYATLARKYPGQIVRIYIRDVLPLAESERVTTAFQGLPRDRYEVFRETAELRRSSP